LKTSIHHEKWFSSNTQTKKGEGSAVFLGYLNQWVCSFEMFDVSREALYIMPNLA
jgi:hypothetical protein